MSTHPHRSRRGSAPALVCAAVPQLAYLTPQQSDHSSRRYALGVWSALSRRRALQWSGEPAPRYHEAGEWWEYVERNLHSGQCMTVIAPIGTHLLTVSGFWDRVSQGQFTVRTLAQLPASRKRPAGAVKEIWRGKLCLRGTPTIVTARGARGSLKILSLSNYLRVTPHTFCSQLCPDVYPPPGWEQEGEPISPPAETECLAISRWARGAISRWLEADLGPWADTAAGLSLSVWRGTDGAGAVYRHTNDDALSIERHACHGGRASVWFYGEVGDRTTCPPPPADPPPPAPWPGIPGRLHLLDFASQYPSLLGSELFPVALAGVCRNVAPSTLPDLLRYWGAVALVELESSRPEYPRRTEAGSDYPVGRYTTALAGPELLSACREGAVRAVPLLARYRLGRPFVAWSRYVLQKRSEARALGDVPGESLWKLTANALGGKFAQSAKRWVPCPGEIAPVLWGEYPRASVAGGRVERRRALSGIPHELVLAQRHPRLPVSVYAYLTSYARRAMRGIRDKLPPRSVVSQHTDGIWVTDKGLRAARRLGLVGRGEFGRLRLVHSADYARFFSPSHYYTDGDWTFAGVANGFRLVESCVAETRQRTEPTQAGNSPDGCQLIETLGRVRLDAIQPVGPVGDDGWSGH